MYEDDAARRQIQMQQAGYNSYGSYGYSSGHNPFEQQGDPFAMSNSIAPPTNVQMAMMQQQMMQHQDQQQHNMMMVPYQNQSQYPQQQQQQQSSPYMGYSNPFGDPFSYSPQNSMSSQGNHTLL